jgi:hypothetical protein
MEYINQYTMYDFITIYCAGILGIILIVVSMGILMMIILVGLDIVSEFWYSIKAKRVKYKQLS